MSKRVVWERRNSLASSTPIAWSSWPNALRDELREQVFEYLPVVAGTSDYEAFPLLDPPVNQGPLTDDARVQGVLSEADAWKLYVKTIAMSLAVELGGYVPWSVTGYAVTSLSALFDSRNMLSYTWPGKVPLPGTPAPVAEGYLLVTNAYDSVRHTTLTRRAAVVIPAPPRSALRFLRDQALLGPTRLDTIENALRWSLRMAHFQGSAFFETSIFERIWQYRGPTPATRMIGTTIDPEWSPDPRHFTAGYSLRMTSST